MDRIIIQLSNNQEATHRIFLQRDAVNLATKAALEANTDFLLDGQSDEFKIAYTNFVNLCQAIHIAKFPAVVEHFHNVKPIGADPYDDTVTRTLFCNRVVDVILGQEFQLPVLVRHFRNDVHIPGEIADFTVVLRGTKERMIEVNGVIISEYDHFYNLSRNVPESTIIEGQLAVEAAAGKFDRPAPLVKLTQ